MRPPPLLSQPMQNFSGQIELGIPVIAIAG
jgi:hypothetical protein